MTGIVAVGFADEAPAKRPREHHWKKSLSTDRKIGLNKIFNIMCLSFENKEILKN